MKRGLVLLALVLTVGSSSWAFNGNRKGFVLGGGLGYVPLDHWYVNNSYLGLYDTSETAHALGAKILIGYAWSEHDMIVYENTFTVFKSGYFSTPSGDRTVIERVIVLAWYHYFGKVGHSLFVAGGPGVYVFDVQGLNVNNPGAAVMLGGGYEFKRNVQVGLYFIHGRTKGPDFDYHHSQLSAIISYTLF